MTDFNQDAAAQAKAEQFAAGTTQHDAASAGGWERGVLEKLAFAALEEQRVSRRWKLFSRISWLVLLVLGLWLALGTGGGSKNLNGPHTAMVEIKGEIASGAEASAELVIAAMRAAFEEREAQAIVLLINSPGGSPVQAGIINDEIIRLKAKYKKPVYVVVEESCASAA